MEQVDIDPMNEILVLGESRLPAEITGGTASVSSDGSLASELEVCCINFFDIRRLNCREISGGSRVIQIYGSDKN